MFNVISSFGFLCYNLFARFSHLRLLIYCLFLDFQIYNFTFVFIFADVAGIGLCPFSYLPLEINLSDGDKGAIIVLVVAGWLRRLLWLIDTIVELFGLSR